MSARTLPSRLALAAGATLALGLLGGCASTVSASDVEEQISTQLAEQVGTEPESVSCPEDLDAEEGATETCTLEADGEEYDVAIEVTEVDGENVNFSIEVASEPN